VFGYKDIDFEESEEFSKKYLLRGPDVIAIRGVFTLSARVQLESQPGWSVQCRAGRLIVFRARDAATAEELPTLAANASRIADALWPR
jgi:hypothetical protein